MEKGGILDDCGPSSVAAMVSWASGYEKDFSAGDGIEWKKKVTGQKDIDGKSDNGSSLAQLIQVANAMGAKARWAKSWDDVVASAKEGAAIGVWVQQPIGYPEGVEISEWHRKWAKWWGKGGGGYKQSPKHIDEGYGHMTSAGWDPEEGWQWACPTRSGKGKEQFAVKVTEEQLLKIADSKRVSGSNKAPAFKHTMIVHWPGRKVSQSAPVAPVSVPAPVAQQSVVAKKPVVAAAPAPKSADKKMALGDSAKSKGKPPEAIDPAVQAQIDALGKVDWGKVGKESLALAGKAADAAGKEKTAMGKVVAFVKYVLANSQIDEMALDAVRTFITVSLSVALGLGIPILDISGGDFRTVLSAGLASALQVVVKALDPNNSSYGVQKK